MEILEILLDLLKYLGVLIASMLTPPFALFLVFLVIALVERVIAAARRRLATTFVLMVRHDERAGVLHPSVQLGAGTWSRARRLMRRRSGPRSIRLQLVDGLGRIRHEVERRFSPEALNRELSLPAFAPPAGASARETLSWHWDVALRDGEGERLRWREHPRPAAELNAEAELTWPSAGTRGDVAVAD